MDLYLLRARRDAEVQLDLQSAGLVAYRPMCTIECWNPRKSVVVRRQSSLLPGHLLVSSPMLPPKSTRHSCRFYVDHASGAPLRVPEADDLILRCEMGEFDVLRAHESPLAVGARVCVVLLDMLGVIERRARDGWSVLLDTGRHVAVGAGGLSPV